MTADHLSLSTNMRLKTENFQTLMGGIILDGVDALMDGVHAFMDGVHAFMDGVYAFMDVEDDTASEDCVEHTGQSATV